MELALKGATLQELVDHATEIERQMAETGEQAPEELYYAKEVATKLLAGRVDQAAELRAAVESRIEALTEALSGARQILERIEFCFAEAVKMTPEKRLDGLAWSAAMQKNGGTATLIVEDDTKIPDAYRRVTVSITERFAADEKDTREFWSGVILKRQITPEAPVTEAESALLASRITVEVDKSKINAALKAAPGSVQGVRQERGEHLRISKGKAKLTAPKEKTIE